MLQWQLCGNANRSNARHITILHNITLKKHKSSQTEILRKILLFTSHLLGPKGDNNTCNTGNKVHVQLDHGTRSVAIIRSTEIIAFFFIAISSRFDASFSSRERRATATKFRHSAILVTDEFVADLLVHISTFSRLVHAVFTITLDAPPSIHQ